MISNHVCALFNQEILRFNYCILGKLFAIEKAPSLLILLFTKYTAKSLLNYIAFNLWQA